MLQYYILHFTQMLVLPSMCYHLRMCVISPSYASVLVESALYKSFEMSPLLICL